MVLANPTHMVAGFNQQEVEQVQAMRALMWSVVGLKHMWRCTHTRTQTHTQTHARMRTHKSTCTHKHAHTHTKSFPRAQILGIGRTLSRPLTHAILGGPHKADIVDDRHEW
jgi:hypothetical protein